MKPGLLAASMDLFCFYRGRLLLERSIGSKSLDLRKKVGVKFYDLFLLTEWLERNFSYLSIILPLDFSEI